MLGQLFTQDFLARGILDTPVWRGLGNAALDILDTFPIVRGQETVGFGRYLTKDLVLAYMNAVADGDFQSRVQA